MKLIKTKRCGKPSFNCLPKKYLLLDGVTDSDVVILKECGMERAERYEEDGHEAWIKG